nr:vegetative cell wall protein gp1-like [Aegilops tauschii subsp. strangulata]
MPCTRAAAGPHRTTSPPRLAPTSPRASPCALPAPPSPRSGRAAPDPVVIADARRRLVEPDAARCRPAPLAPALVPGATPTPHLDAAGPRRPSSSSASTTPPRRTPPRRRTIPVVLPEHRCPVPTAPR